MQFLREQGGLDTRERYLDDQELFDLLNNPSMRVGHQDKDIGQVYVLQEMPLKNNLINS